MAGGAGLILLAAAALATSVLEDAWRRCAQADPDIAISGCGAVIATGEESRAKLAAAHFNRGIAYRNKSQFERAHKGADPDTALDRALAEYAEALRLKPDYAEALVNRAIVWFDKGQYARAIADCDRAIQLRSDLAEAWNNRAIAWYRQGRYDLAQPDFDRTIALRKIYGNALILRSLSEAGRERRRTSLSAAHRPCARAEHPCDPRAASPRAKPMQFPAIVPR
jgi:tetratricopeptide (TPR) repeat protein